MSLCEEHTSLGLQNVSLWGHIVGGVEKVGSCMVFTLSEGEYTIR